MNEKSKHFAEQLAADMEYVFIYESHYRDVVEEKIADGTFRMRGFLGPDPYAEEAHRRTVGGSHE